MRCKHTKHDGSPCGAYAIGEGEYCWLHSPDVPDEEKREAQSRGGKAGESVKTALPPLEGSIPLKTPEDVLAVIRRALQGVVAGTVDIRTANSVGYLTDRALRAMEASDVVQRLRAIEAALISSRSR